VTANAIDALYSSTFLRTLYASAARSNVSRIDHASMDNPAAIAGVPFEGFVLPTQIVPRKEDRLHMGRLTYCFSKKWANHRAALAVFFCHYNYCRKHATLKGHTPAMAHGLTSDVWSARKMLETVLAGQ
jgi:hypothetical protein